MLGGTGRLMLGAIARVRCALVPALTVAALVPATLAGGSGAAQAFPPVDLGTLGGDSSGASAINDAGQSSATGRRRQARGGRSPGPRLVASSTSAPSAARLRRPPA
jgi:hypothetical protein